MSLSDALRRLDDSDRHVRRQAVDDLIAIGTSEVLELMLDRIRDETTQIQWPGPVTVLEELGDPAFGPLVTLLASDVDAEVSRRAGSAFGNLRVSSPQMFVDVLAHP